jgi:UPF0176 protein
MSESRKTMTPVRHNRINRRELRLRMASDATPRLTLSFYAYARIADPAAWRDELYDGLSALGVLGRIYVAHEGINAQISLPEHRLEDLRQFLAQWPFLQNIRLNFAVQNRSNSFYVLKIKVRPKIVADGLDDATFDASQTGTPLDAETFNALTDRPETLVVDLRNHYECEVGHFENALCFDTDTFRQTLAQAEAALAEAKDRPIVMYCTGGIRCEKASAWLRHRGFQQVYQLEGGIIEYARQVRERNLRNKFIGVNFVFDERLSERIGPQVIARCHQCGTPWDTHTNCRNEACHVLFLQCPTCAETYSGCCSEACRDFIALPAETQQVLRKGFRKPTSVYRKGRPGANAHQVRQLLERLRA